MSNDVNWTICFFDILWIYPPGPQDASLASLRHHQDYYHFLREGKFPRNNLHLPLSRSKNEGLVGIPFPTSDGDCHPPYSRFPGRGDRSKIWIIPFWNTQLQRGTLHFRGKKFRLAHLFGQLAWKKNHPRTTQKTPGGKKPTHPTVVSLASAWKFWPWITHKKWYLLPT